MFCRNPEHVALTTVHVHREAHKLNSFQVN